MISAKDFLKYKFDELNGKLEHNLLRAKVVDAMEQYALEVAEGLVKNCNTPAVSESVEPVGEPTVCLRNKISPYDLSTHGGFNRRKKGQTGR